MSTKTGMTKRQKIKLNVLNDLVEYARYVNDYDVSSYFLLASSPDRDSTLIAYDFDELNSMVGRLELALQDLKMMAVEKQRRERVVFEEKTSEAFSSVLRKDGESLN